MPVYHFTVSHDGKTNEAHDLELPDIHAAWEEATMSAGELLRELDGSLKPGTEWAIQITDEFQNRLRSIRIVTETIK